MRQNHFFRAFEGLRGVAVLSVVIFHCTYGWPGYLAVECFMLLSGFVLAHTCLDRSDRPDGKEFVLRRLARLYPIHFLGILAYALVYWLIHDGQWPSYPDGTLFTLLQHLTLLHNVGFNPHGLTWNFPDWCVSVELWVNVIVFFVLPLRMKTAHLLLISLAAYLLIFNNSHRLGVHHEVYWGWLASGLVRGFAGFMLGWFVYRIHVELKSGRLISQWSATFMELLILACLVPIFWLRLQDGETDFIALGLMALLLLVLSQERGAVSQILSTSVAVYLGRISYPIYILHITVLDIFYQNQWHAGTLGLPLFLAEFIVTVVAVSSLAHHWIEEPCRRWYGRYRQNQQLTLAMAGP
ncbi:MAG: acyltransferase [Methylococcaceae bacterium]|nr:acyltransferase [Methylococcaceae bacterium]